MSSTSMFPDRSTPDVASSLTTSGRTALLIVAAGLGLLAAIGVVRKLAQRLPEEDQITEAEEG